MLKKSCGVASIALLIASSNRSNSASLIALFEGAGTLDGRIVISPKLSTCHFRAGLRPFDRGEGSRSRSFLDEVVAVSWSQDLPLDRGAFGYSQEIFNQSGLKWDRASGARVLALWPALKAWGMYNGLGPGRARNPDKSRHYETALRGSASNDITTARARFGYDRSRR
jgi:hypothetical protein